MHSNYGFEYLRRQKINIVTRLLAKALHHREEQRAWGMWLKIYPYMIVPQPMEKSPRLKFTPFSKFYQAQTQPKEDARTPEQIDTEISKVVNLYEIKKKKAKKT